MRDSTLRLALTQSAPLADPRSNNRKVRTELVALVAYISTSHSVDRYFATTADGRIMQLVPLDQPNMATAALMSWVAQATSEVMTFGFHDYQRRLQQSSRHFTHHGWETFTAALNNCKDSAVGGAKSLAAFIKASTGSVSSIAPSASSFADFRRGEALVRLGFGLRAPNAVVSR